MKKILVSILLMLVIAPSALAQFTTVTGTVTDPNGLPYAFGTISAGFVTTASPTLNGLPYTPPSQPTGLDKNGSFIMQLGDNNILLPAGTKWNFLVCSAAGTIQPSGGKGPVCFSVAPITITGASQSISATLNAAALALSSSSGASINPTNGFVPKRLNATSYADSAIDDGVTAAGRVSISETVNLPLLRVNSALLSAAAAARMEEHSTSSSKSIFIQFVDSNGGGAGGGVPSLTQFANNGTEAVPVAIVSGTAVMKISGGGYDGSAAACVLTGFCETAEIIATADENFDATHHGTHIDFLVTPDGTANNLGNKATLDNAGNFILAGTGTGSFSAPAGTQAKASYSLTGTPGVGIYFPDTATTAFTSGASEQLQINTAGLLTKPPVCDFNTGTNCLTFASGLISTTGSGNPAFKANSYQSTSNCSSSAAPAVCGSAPDGSVVIAAAATTVTVNTTAVTANSQILLAADDTLGTKLSVTCNSTLATLVGGLAITTRTAGTSFQITSGATPAVNPLCISYSIVN